MAILETSGGRMSGGRRPCRTLGVVLSALSAWALAWPAPAPAAPGCSATVVHGFSFGGYDVFSPAPLTATARIRVVCPGQTVQIAIGPGNSSRFDQREMRSGDGVLRYNVYQDPGLSVVWGDGTDGTSLVTVTGTAQLVAYASVPPHQDAPAGAYFDDLVVTVFF